MLPLVRWLFRTTVFACCLFLALAVFAQNKSLIGKEVAIPRHLQNGEEYRLSIPQLIAFGDKLFEAKWTSQEGEGRPLAKGTGTTNPTLSDPSSPLVFPRNFNRISGPDSNSCSGCHNEPFVGGGGDRVTEVFVEGNRFDFATFDHTDGVVTRGAVAENGQFVTLQEIADERKTISMNGSGFIEMLARQMTGALQQERNALKAGQSVSLTANGVNFGTLSRNADGTWDTSKVAGITSLSLSSTGPENPPTLIIMPFQQASSVVSLRQFTNNAFNQHHGIQSEERFGVGVDQDGDGFVNELTRADVTAVAMFQATLPVPGQIVPDDPDVQAAVAHGQKLFSQIGCASCHVPALPLYDKGWIYSEPNPYNPAGNLQTGQAPLLSVDLTSDDLPGPRLKPDRNGVVWVPAFTDLKLHDICLPTGDPNAEALNQNAATSSPAFADGNRFFITRKLWGFANEGPFMHHGKFTTIREAIENHNGEAAASRQAFDGLSDYDRDSIIEFLKTLQVLPQGARSLVVTKHYSDFE
jgi:hypothetical protein